MKKFVKLTGLLALLLGLFVVSGCDQITTLQPDTKTTTADKGETESTEDPLKDYYERALDADLAAVESVVAKKVKTFKKLSLPTECANGSKVAWATSDATVIKADGSLGAFTNDGLNPDGTLPTATLTATLSLGGYTREYSVEVTVDRMSEDAEKVVAARSGILTQYEGNELVGYDLSFSQEGKTVYNLQFVERKDVTVKYLNSQRVTFDQTGTKALVNRPTKEECIEGQNYVFDTITVEITSGNCKISFDMVVEITAGQELTSLRQIKTEMAEENWVSEKGKTEYLFSGTVSLVWESTDSYQGFYVQKDGFGIYVYSAGTTGATPKVTEGDEIVMAAVLTIYSGLPETDKVNSITIITPAAENQENIDKVTPVEVTAQNFNATGMALKDGLVASVAKLIFISGKMQSGTSAQLTFRIAGASENVTVTCGKYTSDFNNIMTFVNGLKTGDVVEVSKCAIGWYNTNPQLVFTNAKYLQKSTTPLTDAEKVVLDEQLSELKVADFVAPNTDYTLPTTMFGSTVKWTVTGELATVEGDKLKVGSFNENTTLVLKAKLSSGEVEGTKEFSFEIPALVPLTYAQVVEAYTNDTLPEGSFAITLNVYDKFGNIYFAAADGNDDLIVLHSEANLVEFSSSVLLVSDVEYLGETYHLYVESAPGYTLIDRYVGKVTELSNIATLDATKAVLLDVTIENGSAKISDSLSMEFYTDTELKNALPDGKYNYLEVYVDPTEDSTTVVGLVVSQTSIKEVNALTDKKAAKFQGLVVAIMSSGSVLVADNSGQVMTVYLNASYRDAVKVGEAYVFEGETAYYNDIIQVSVSKVAPVHCVDATGKAPYSFAAIEKVATVVDADDYKELTAKDKMRTIYKITGLTYDADTTDDYNNVYLKAKDETSIKVINYSKNFGQTADYATYEAALAPAKANPANYTITLVVVDNIYENNGSLVVQAYPIVELVTVTEVTE